jgi:hypothetical protein
LHAFPFCQVITQRQKAPAVSAAVGAKDGAVIEAASLCVNAQAARRLPPSPIGSRFECSRSFVERLKEDDPNGSRRIEWRYAGAVVTPSLRTSRQAGDEDQDGERHDSPGRFHGGLLG